MAVIDLTARRDPQEHPVGLPMWHRPVFWSAAPAPGVVLPDHISVCYFTQQLVLELELLFPKDSQSKSSPSKTKCTLPRGKPTAHIWEQSMNEPCCPSTRPEQLHCLPSASSLTTVLISKQPDPYLLECDWRQSSLGPQLTPIQQPQICGQHSAPFELPERAPQTSPTNPHMKV